MAPPPGGPLTNKRRIESVWFVPLLVSDCPVAPLLAVRPINLNPERCPSEQAAKSGVPPTRKMPSEADKNPLTARERNLTKVVLAKTDAAVLR